MRVPRPQRLYGLPVERRAVLVQYPRAHQIQQRNVTVTAVSGEQPCTTARPWFHNRQIWHCQTRSQHYSSRSAPPSSTRSPDSDSQNSSGYHHGPHKEYFQNPGQAPRPDFTPYERPQMPYPAVENASHSTYFQSTGQPQQTPSPAQPIPDAATKRNSIPRRLLRSTIYSVLFLGLGVAAGTALITWEYLSPMFEEDSEEEKEIIEEILETIEESSLVAGLREEGWREFDLYMPRVGPDNAGQKSMAADMDKDTGNTVSGADGRSKGIGTGKEMLLQVLTGSKGLVGLKMFYHPQQEVSVMVFFTGFGLDGWPDKIHGGALTTLLQEAIMRHIHQYHHGQLDDVANLSLKLNFAVPVQPGSVYAVVVPPVTFSDHPTPGNPFLQNVPSNTLKMRAVGLFMQIDEPPQVASGSTLTNQGAGEQHTLSFSGAYGHTPEIHAFAEATITVRSKTNNSSSFLESIAESNAKFGTLPNKSQDSED